MPRAFSRIGGEESPRIQARSIEQIFAKETSSIPALINSPPH